MTVGTPLRRPGLGALLVAAGGLIAASGAVNVLLRGRSNVPRVDPAPGDGHAHRPSLAATEESGGVLAGLRYILRDGLLGPMMITVVVGNMVYQALFFVGVVTRYRASEPSVAEPV